MSYFWFKALHLIAMVVWFAGLFYMFRLFVYHVENKDKPDATNMLKTMERKLFYYITTPGMIATLIFGFGLLLNSKHNIKLPWMHIKLSLIFLMVIYHLFIVITLNRFKQDEIFLSSKQCRFLNEVPTLFLLGIVFIAVFRNSL